MLFMAAGVLQRVSLLHHLLFNLVALQQIQPVSLPLNPQVCLQPSPVSGLLRSLLVNPRKNRQVSQRADHQISRLYNRVVSLHVNRVFNLQVGRRVIRAFSLQGILQRNLLRDLRVNRRVNQQRCLQISRRINPQDVHRGSRPCSQVVDRQRNRAAYLLANRVFSRLVDLRVNLLHNQVANRHEGQRVNRQACPVLFLWHYRRGNRRGVFLVNRVERLPISRHCSQVFRRVEDHQVNLRYSQVADHQHNLVEGHRVSHHYNRPLSQRGLLVVVQLVNHR